MVKKICPQCRSKRFTKNSTGSYVCESGHVYAGYQEEEGEFDATMGTARYRRMKGPKRKRKDPLVGQLVGVEDEKATLQAVQLVLRHQLWWLVHEKGFPKEIQAVAREYWAACLMNFRKYQDHDLGLLQPTTKGQESTPETDAQDPEAKSIAGKKSHKKTRDGLDSMAEFQEPDSDTSSEDENSDNQDDMEGEGKYGEDTASPTQAQARKNLKTPRKIYTRTSGDRYVTQFDAGRPSLDLAVSICYLASVHLKLPVIIGDFYRQVDHDETDAVLQFNQHIATKYDSHHGIFNQCSTQAQKSPNDRLNYTHVPCDSLQSFTKNMTPKLSWGTEGSYCDFIVIRVLERDPKSWINTLPKEQSWMRSLDIFDRLQAQVTIPTALGEMEDIARVNSDLYGEFCKSSLLSVPEESYQSLLRPFAATEYSRKEQHLDGSGERKVPGIDAFIRHLYMTVPPPQDAVGRNDPSAPPPLAPGEGYVYYIPDPSDTYLGHYGRLLGHVGNMMATSVAEIERNVQIVEEFLFTNINKPAKVASVNSLYADTPKSSKKKKKLPKSPEPLRQEYATPSGP
ncbi:Pol I core factor CF [Podila minutissima]|nr:Pol I core factor CF [Podila minutissima]